MYHSPPLQPVMTAAQKLSIGLVLLADGAQGAAGLPAGMGATGIGSAWGAASSASSWMLTASIPAGRSIALFPPPLPLPFPRQPCGCRMEAKHGSHSKSHNHVLPAWVAALLRYGKEHRSGQSWFVDRAERA